MAQKSTKEPEAQTNLAVSQPMPSFMTVKQDGPTGLENLKKYFVPPRAKIVQAQSGDAFKDFEEGTIIMVPQMVKIALPGQPFWITPIFQFTEFCVWNPYALKNQLPVIRQRDFNPDGEIARKARSKATWHEICPEAPKAKQNDSAMMLRYCEHINFLCVLAVSPDDPLYRVPFAISFHHSGFRTGQNLASLLLMRRYPSGDRATIYSSVYEAKTEEQKNDLGKWMGLKVSNPSAASGISQWVSDDDFATYRDLFNGFADLQARNEIMPDYDDEAVAAETTADSGGKF